jgi:hypothetical protein
MITETYRDVEITLLEDENKWRFTANGRQRTALSLPKAREAIDKTLDDVKTTKEKPWEPFDVYLLESNYGHEYAVVTVTSIADTTAWDKTPDIWISNDGKRKKTSLRSIFTLSDDNAERIVKIKQLAKQAADLNAEIQQLKTALNPVTLPTNGTEEILP